MDLKNRIVNKLKLEWNRLKSRKKTKYFCIGRNKTGTTSLEKAFKELGFVVGNQRQAELLMEDYFKGDFTRIIDYCKSPEVFQDVPFSMAETYKILDKKFPNSKFILTVRNDSEQWYNSLVNFHIKSFGISEPFSWEKIKKIDYVYEGWIYNQLTKQYGLTEEEEPYNKEKLILHYERYNEDVKKYFKDRPQDLLIINLAEKDSYCKLCNFIGVKPNRLEFPWENKTN